MIKTKRGLKMVVKRMKKHNKINQRKKESQLSARIRINEILRLASDLGSINELVRI